MTPLALAMFLSGAAALLFEALWFRLAGLSLGNSVAASSLVLAAFMGGLAAGNAAAAWIGPRVCRPLRTYALLEVAVGASGLGLVLVFPSLGELLLPVLRATGEQPWLLNPIRAGAAFAAMVLPATAMGATLPLALRGAAAPATMTGRNDTVGVERRYGRDLGMLYGLNTLGAVAGALLAESVFIPAVGIRGTGFVAALFNLAAAGMALSAAGRVPARVGHRLGLRAVVPTTALGLLACSFLAGALLLALEVVWFRLLLLFVDGTSLAFAVMLAVILLGIGLGGLAASVWLALHGGAPRLLPHAAGLAGILTLASYWYGHRLPPLFSSPHLYAPLEVFALSSGIALPVCALSGVIFTLLGTTLRREILDEASATGALALANTLGALMGALLAGFVLLPRLGIERSVLLLAAGYGVVAVVAWRSVQRRERLPRLSARVLGSEILVLVLSLALLPFGGISQRYLGAPVRAFAAHGRPIVIREGLSETLILLRKERWGEPYYHLLLTNGFSMAASVFGGRRYMSLFAYWPIVFRPGPRSALLISYGLGVTGKALTEAGSLERLEVVDISPDVLEVGSLVFPPPESSALADPRTRAHIEDGRFFLLSSPDRFDIITAEPPPPKHAGVVNLYSREYFALVRERLADQGVCTHWLPVDQLGLGETRSVIRGFCDVFEDCSLWSGMMHHWMLVGTRGLEGPLSVEQFSQPWQDATLGPSLRGLGFETPGLLAATFLADASTLRRLTAGTEPLDDDHPYRLSPHPVAGPDRFYWEFMDPIGARDRFGRSSYVSRLMSPELRQLALEAYGDRQIWLQGLGILAGRAPEDRFRWLADTLTGSALRTPVLLCMDSDDRLQMLVDRAVSRGLDDPEIDYQLAVRAMAERDYARAERLLDRSQPVGPGPDPVTYYRILAAHLGGDSRLAHALAETARERYEALAAAGQTPRADGFWEWWWAASRAESPE